MIIKFKKCDSYSNYQKINVIVNGVLFGDSLDDNSYEEDGYRFHDLYHCGLYKWFGIKNGVYNTLMNNLKPTYRNKMEECVALLMFQFSNSKLYDKDVNAGYFNTIIDLLSMLTNDSLQNNKFRVMAFMNNIHKLITEARELMIKNEEVMIIFYEDGFDYKIEKV